MTEGCAYGILQGLPASRMTHLHCGLGYSSANTLRALTALSLMGSTQTSATEVYVYMHTQPADMLAPLSALKQLVQLRLGGTHPDQLRHLPPRLQVLDVHCVRAGPKEQLWLGHLTSLSALHGSRTSYPYVGLSASDVLPPNLRVLNCHAVAVSSRCWPSAAWRA